MGETGRIRRALGWTGRLALTAIAGLVVGAVLLIAYAGIVYLRLPSVGAVGAQGDPGPTPFMRTDRCERIDVEYLPLVEIDPRLACVIVWSEDRKFFYHDGVDTEALDGAVRANWAAKDFRFGGSTIPMQVARNLFLSRSRTPTRKLQEVVLARRLVEHYDRLRILELYLNIAEWAPCVYGVHAAAKHYFGHGAEVLDGAEATFLAAMLPRPRRPPKAEDRRPMQKRQHVLLTLLTRAQLVSPAETSAERGGVVAIWREREGHLPRTHAPAPRDWYERACGTRASGLLPPSR